MRIPFPERVPINSVALFTLVLFVVQWIEGTALYFRFGCAACILISALAFNTAGGLTRASGAYIFFYSTLVFIIGFCYKAFLGEPGQSNLLDPRTTMAVYVGGTTAMLAAVIVSSRFRRKAGLLENLLKESRMYRASIGCIAFGVFGGSIFSLLGGPLASAFTQLNFLIPLGIIIGVMYEIRRSGGSRSANLPIALAGIYFVLFYGLFGLSKEGMLLPGVCWLFPVCALRFRLSALQIGFGLAGAFVIFYYLVPYSQYGRSQVEEGQSQSQRIAIETDLLLHPDRTRRAYNEIETAGSLSAYYDTPQGFWDRLQFISVDDRLIDVTNHGHVFGLLPLKAEALNAVPHFLWPDKPNINFGNVYAHEIGELAPEDTSTGVSFSPTAEAYHMDTWIGVLVIAPVMWFLLFVVFDSFFGDLRATPWGLLVMAIFSHSAPEGALTGLVYLLTYALEAMVFCAFFATWVAPLFAIPILGPERKAIKPQPAFQPTLPSQVLE